MNENLKGCFPFRLGTTSYIVPDEIIPNVLYLSDKVDDIELVLFESDEVSNIPDAETISLLAELAGAHDLTYTVHLPLDTFLGHGDETIRKRSVDKCLRVIDRTLPLAPFAYIVHFHGDERGPVPSPDMDRWLDHHRRSMEELKQLVPGTMFAVETLDYPYSMIENVVWDSNLSICLDAGHVMLCGFDLDTYLERYAPFARVFHVHGIRDGVDHQNISWMRKLDLEKILASVKTRAPDVVMTLELFGNDDFQRSIDVLRRCER